MICLTLESFKSEGSRVWGGGSSQGYGKVRGCGQAGGVVGGSGQGGWGCQRVWSRGGSS